MATARLITDRHGPTHSIARADARPAHCLGRRFPIIAWYYVSAIFRKLRTLVPFRPAQGSSYIPTPRHIAAKTCVVNVQNRNDELCFLYSILAHIHRVESERNPSRVCHNRPHLAELVTTCLKFPLYTRSYVSTVHIVLDAKYTLTDHIPNCSTHTLQTVTYPVEGKDAVLHYKTTQKEIPVPYLLYVDFETFIEPSADRDCQRIRPVRILLFKSVEI